MGSQRQAKQTNLLDRTWVFSIQMNGSMVGRRLILRAGLVEYTFGPGHRL